MSIVIIKPAIFCVASSFFVVCFGMWSQGNNHIHTKNSNTSIALFCRIDANFVIIKTACPRAATFYDFHWIYRRLGLSSTTQIFHIGNGKARKRIFFTCSNEPETIMLNSLPSHPPLFHFSHLAHPRFLGLETEREIHSTFPT